MCGMWLCTPLACRRGRAWGWPKEKLKIFEIWGNPLGVFCTCCIHRYAFVFEKKSLIPLLSNGEIAAALDLSQSPPFTPTRGEREKGKIDRRIEETLYKPLIWSHKLRKEKKRKVARRESASNPRHEAIKTETPYELTGGIASFKMAARKH